MKRAFDMSALNEAIARAAHFDCNTVLFDLLTKTDYSLSAAKRIVLEHATILPRVLNEVDQTAMRLSKTKVCCEVFEYVIEKELRKRRIG